MVRLVRGRDLRRGDVLVEARPGGRVTRELVVDVDRRPGSVVAYLDDGTDGDGRRVAVCCDDSGVLVADAPRAEERFAS